MASAVTSTFNQGNTATSYKSLNVEGGFIYESLSNSLHRILALTKMSEIFECARWQRLWRNAKPSQLPTLTTNGLNEVNDDSTIIDFAIAIISKHDETRFHSLPFLGASFPATSCLPKPHASQGQQERCRQ